MTSSEYSARSRTVRRAAKDLLRKYREDRRRRDARDTCDETAAASDEQVDVVAVDEQAVTAPGATLRASARAEMLARTAENEAAAALKASEEEASADEPFIEVDEAVLDSDFDDASEETTPEIVEEEPEGAAPDEQDPASQTPLRASRAQATMSEPSDLDRVPGLGPGLIWVLRQAGVHSLDDLAAADADALRAHLGVIGELVDVESWIDWAKARPAA